MEDVVEQKLESVMAKGISIKDVENKVQNINDNNVLPISTGADVPEVVTVGVLKEYINEDVETAIEGKQDVINDLSAIRNGAALGATAVQTESDPTVPAWAKAEQKPSYTAAEVGALPDTTAIPTESTVSGWGFTKNTGTVTSVTVNGSTYNPTNGDVDLGTIGGGGTSVQADWAQTDSTANDFVKNKPSVNSFYYAAWTATSSAALNTRLTNTLVLPEGVYILRGQSPVVSRAISVDIQTTNATTASNAKTPTNPSTSSFYGQNYALIVDIVFVGAGGGEIYLKTGSSSSTTYTYLDRGFLTAIKIA